jgi:hypothetical protein
MLKLSKPVVWFDIDDVILHLWPSLIKYYNLEYWTKNTLKDNWYLEKDKVYNVVDKYNLYRNMVPTNILPILRWKRKDIYLIMITSRENRYMNDTIWELNDQWLNFDDIFMWEKKSEVCKSEKVDHFFDDALHNIIDIKNNSPKTKDYLVGRDWNWSEELTRLNVNGLICNDDIKRLTEKEICDILIKL